jgi:hypothetical protein
MSVLNEDSLVSTVNWLSIANDAIYTAIDEISQLVLVSILTYNSFLINVFLFKNLNEALPMLGHVAPTIGYGYPVPFITRVFRCLSTKINWISH